MNTPYPKGVDTDPTFMLFQAVVHDNVKIVEFMLTHQPEAKAGLIRSLLRAFDQGNTPMWDLLLKHTTNEELETYIKNDEIFTHEGFNLGLKRELRDRTERNILRETAKQQIVTEI